MNSAFSKLIKKHIALLLFSEPKPECVADSECPNDKACINQMCRNPCTAGVCAFNAECHVQYHRPICACRPGLTGDARTQCYESE